MSKIKTVMASSLNTKSSSGDDTTLTTTTATQNIKPLVPTTGLDIAGLSKTNTNNIVGSILGDSIRNGTFASTTKDLNLGGTKIADVMNGNASLSNDQLSTLSSNIDNNKSFMDKYGQNTMTALSAIKTGMDVFDYFDNRGTRKNILNEQLTGLKQNNQAMRDEIAATNTYRNAYKV